MSLTFSSWKSTRSERNFDDALMSEAEDVANSSEFGIHITEELERLSLALHWSLWQ